MLALAGGKVLADHFMDSYRPCKHALGTENVFYLATIVSHFAAATPSRVWAVG